MKGAVAFRANREIKPKFKLSWQEGYGVLSLRRDELGKVSHYIDNQERHHATGRVSDLMETIEANDEDLWPAET